MPDGFGGLGLAAKISGLWPRFLGRDEEESEDEAQGRVSQPGGWGDARTGGGAQLGDGGSDGSGRYYVVDEPEGPEPPMSTTGKSYYESEGLFEPSTDPRDGGGGWGDARQGGGSGPRWGS